MRCLKWMALGFFVCLWAVPLSAAQLTSADFSFALGATGSAPTWSDSENAGTNSPATQGSFTFAVTATGPYFSGRGPTFVNRTLGTGSDGDWSGFVGDSSNNMFQLHIVGGYDGPAPGDASATPNYELTIEITKVSIYGGAHPASSSLTLEINEITAGHEQVSPSLDLTPSASWDDVSAYQQLIWNPTDYSVSLAGLNDTFTRTFATIPLDVNDLRYLDGLEIEGRIHLTYNAVPEPNTQFLVLLGVGTLLGVQRYRKSNG